MNNAKLTEISECMGNIDDKALVWSMVYLFSRILNENAITYNQFIAIFDIIDNYTHGEAAILSDDEDISSIDLDGEDGEWFNIPVIG